jgi:16S rRNA processing protein RimM
MEEEGSAGPSPASRDQPSHLVIGRILSPHGVKGEVETEVLTDFPDRFGLLKTVYLGEELHPVVVEGHRFNKNRVILKLVGCEDRNEAGTLRGKLIHVPLEEAISLEKDEYYVYQILGSEVWTTEGELLGSVDDVLFTGSNDVYVVNLGDQQVLIPAISDVVKEVDISRGRIEVQLMEGLR